MALTIKTAVRLTAAEMYLRQEPRQEERALQPVRQIRQADQAATQPADQLHHVRTTQPAHLPDQVLNPVVHIQAVPIADLLAHPIRVVRTPLIQTAQGHHLRTLEVAAVAVAAVQEARVEVRVVDADNLSGITKESLH